MQSPKDKLTTNISKLIKNIESLKENKIYKKNTNFLLGSCLIDLLNLEKADSFQTEDYKSVETNLFKNLNIGTDKKSKYLFSYHMRSFNLYINEYNKKEKDNEFYYFNENQLTGYEKKILNWNVKVFKTDSEIGLILTSINEKILITSEVSFSGVNNTPKTPNEMTIIDLTKEKVYKIKRKVGNYKELSNVMEENYTENHFKLRKFYKENELVAVIARNETFNITSGYFKDSEIKKYKEDKYYLGEKHKNYKEIFKYFLFEYKGYNSKKGEKLLLSYYREYLDKSFSLFSLSKFNDQELENLHELFELQLSI
tara:strand:+ start:10932 stop:11867 length:936 start_codon:yes stop_codon:yes gene_type:complete